MYDPHYTRGGDENCGFSSLATKPVVMVCLWFDLKTTTIISCFDPQNQGRWFGGLTSKPVLRFGHLGLKITVMVSYLGPQNQGEEV
jgi:hypothetical protein